MPTQKNRTDAIALLKDDHKKVRALLDKLEKTTERAGDTREELLARIEQEIKIHTTIEEEIFYPAYKAAVTRKEDTKLYQEALEEHHVADTVLTELKASEVKSEVFSAKAKVLKEVVEHHAREEETEMFPRARRAMEASELLDLGTQMLERKRELEAQNEGWLPAAGKLLAAAASRVTGGIGKSRPQSVAARGAAPKKRTARPAAGRSRSKTAKASGAKAAKARKK